MTVENKQPEEHESKQDEQQSTLVGEWALDAGRSDSVEPMLKLMGVPMLLRKAAVRMRPRIALEHSLTDDGRVCITFTISGFIKNETAPRVVGEEAVKSTPRGEQRITLTSVAEDSRSLTVEKHGPKEGVRVLETFTLEEGGDSVHITIQPFIDGAETPALTINRYCNRA